MKLKKITSLAMFRPGTSATAEPSPAIANMVDKNRVKIK